MRSGGFGPQRTTWATPLSSNEYAVPGHNGIGVRSSSRVHSFPLAGAVAQSGERSVRNAEVVGSTPIGSTNAACNCAASLAPVAQPDRASAS